MGNLLWSGVVMLLLLTGCGWTGTPTRTNDFTPLTSITITADYPVIAAHTSAGLKVTGNFSGLFSRDITDQVIWSSDAPGVAAFTSTARPNRVKGVAAGSAIVTATVGSLTATTALTVTAATINTVTLTPDSLTLAKGSSTQFNVTGHFSDSTTQILTSDAVWASSAPDVATVSDAENSKGFAQAIAVGSTNISASFDEITGSAPLTVTVPVLQTIAISPLNPTILSLMPQKFTATGMYSDGSTVDITSQASWSSSDSAFATVNNGLATALAQGSATISAALDGVTGTSALTVTGGNLSAITIQPLSTTLAKDTSTRIKAIGAFTFNGAVTSSRDITGLVTWSTDNSSLATVTSGGGNLERLNAVAVTSGTTITVKSGSVSATATLTVTPATLTAITMTPSTLELISGTSAPLTVTATFSDGTTQDVTALSGWSSANEAKATVGTSGFARGRVTGVAVGTTTISATYGGKTVPTPATVTVVSRILQSLTVTGSASMTAGNQASYTATAVYADKSSKDVTMDTATVWAITPSHTALLADAANQPGEVVAVSSGSATLTATFGVKTAQTTIAVP
jgi:uncharacterized protein YjdB